MGRSEPKQGLETEIGLHVLRRANQIARDGGGRAVIDLDLNLVGIGLRRFQIELTMPPRIQPKQGGSDA